MKFHAPKTLDEAVALLAAEPEARCLAGGQTLVAMMNADLVRPAAIVSLRRIAALGGIRREADGAVAIGAMTSHATLAASALLIGDHALLRLAAERIAHPPIRNAGTIGGALAHADPASDLATALLALGGAIEIAGPAGRRSVAAAAFFIDYLVSALAPGEIVVAIRLPPARAAAGAHYEKLARVDGDYPIVSVAAAIEMAGGLCRHARLAAGAVATTPLHLASADAALVGTPLDDAALRAAGDILTEAAAPLDDIRASAAYRRKVLARLVGRAVSAARGRAAA